MMRYQHQYGARRRFPRRLLMIGCVLALLVLGGVIWVRHGYTRNLQPVSNSHTVQYITILSGTSVHDIAEQLKTAHLIRNSQAFEWYVNSHNERDKLQAGTYAFQPSQSTAEIAEAIATGKVATNLVTILPGQRLDQIRASFLKSDFKAADVDQALRARAYRGSPALADNPSSASLEGFLYPDSYQKTSATDPHEIVSESLQEMQTHLTTEIRNGFAKQGLSVYQGVTLASIVEMEVPKASDRHKVAQVFLKRLKEGMPLGSDVTKIYSQNVGNSAYDTTMHKGLPAGPIATVSDTALQAVAYPASTDWLYFVSGDDGTTHFSHTYEEHKAAVAKYCHKLCAQSN